MPVYRIQPQFYDVPRLMEADSESAATTKVLDILGHETLDRLNSSLYDGSGDDELAVTEVSPDYLAALAVICKDPIMQDVPEDVLMMRQPWEPAPETVEAIRKAVAASGKTSPRHACNVIMGDMHEGFGLPSGDWSWVPMMKLADPDFFIKRKKQ